MRATAGIWIMQVYMMMVQRSRNSLLLAAFIVSVCVPLFLGWTTLGDGCTLADRYMCELCDPKSEKYDKVQCVPDKCPDGCEKDTADEIDAIILAVCWGIALILVVVYICTMTTTLIFGTAPSAGMDTPGTVHVHLTGPEAATDGDRIMKQIHRRRGAVMRGQTR
jgi:hypothetical protein